MDSRAPAVVAVIVTTGSGPGLEVAVASLLAQDYPELSVLVLANGDAFNVPERVGAIAPNAFVRVLEENRGFAAACNEAALMVTGTAFFLFCHDDVRLEPDVIQRMVESAFRTNAGVVTPKYVAYDDPLVLVHVGQASDRFGVRQERVVPGEIDHGQQDLERDVFVAPGGVTLVRADLFAALRGFDPAITMLGEDLDLCWRAQVAGARIVVAPLATVAHRESIATGERAISALGTRGASRRDLSRRHQLLVVASGWSRRSSAWTLFLLATLDVAEVAFSLITGDADRAGAVVSSWRWLVKQRRVVRQRRRHLQSVRVLSDSELHRLQLGGARRLRHFFVTLAREGFDRARGIVPSSVDHDLSDDLSDPTSVGVGFAAAFSELEDFDDIAQSEILQRRSRPSRILTSFRAQVSVIALAGVLWAIGSRNLVASPLPLIGHLAPLDSWWTTWRHFFASWSANGVGTGAPGMPGYGVLGVAGTFVLGRMGILPRLALIFSVPVGSFGVGRLLRDRVSNRARVVGALAYAAMPLGFNMISQGRVDVLVVVALAPFIVRRIFELLDVPGFRRPYGAPVTFGDRGWRTSQAGQRMVLIMLIAVVSALAPATLVVVAIVVVGVVVARVFEPDPLHHSVPPWRFLGSIIVNVAIFLLPLTLDVATAGRRALGVFGLARGPWSVPSFALMLRGADGTFGASWWGWLLPGAAFFALVLCRDERRMVASKLATIGVVTLIVATLSSRHWLGAFAPDLDVLLALYALTLASLIGLGIGALEHDLSGVSFGWRQLVAGVSILTLVVACLPFIASVGSGRFDLPTSSVADSLGALAPTSAGGYRVLWLGDPAVLPLPGWSVTPGLEAATSMNGLPDGNSLFSPPGVGASGFILTAIDNALEGRTIHLGQLLAPAGISTIVVMNASAPELTGVQQVPLHPVPGTLLTALNDQSDLALELQSASFDVYSNSLFHGIVSATTSANSTPAPVFTSSSFSGPLTPGSTIDAGLAPAGAFGLDVNAHPSPRTTLGGWSPYFDVPASTGPLTGEIVLERFPLNGLIAGFTLVVWILLWLGFGWIQRLEWLVTGPRRRSHRAKKPRGSS